MVITTKLRKVEHGKRTHIYVDVFADGESVGSSTLVLAANTKEVSFLDPHTDSIEEYRAALRM